MTALLLSKIQADYIKGARVARLGTVDSKGRAHLVPIVFALVANRIYFVIDRKAKTSSNLKRLRNIAYNGNATLLVDHYSEDWKALSFLIVYCKASIIGPHEKIAHKRMAARELKEKYAQYRFQGYFPEDLDEAVFVSLTPLEATYWQNRR